MLVFAIIWTTVVTSIIIFFNGSDSQEEIENELKEKQFKE